MKDFIKKHFPKTGETYIGLDVAVIIGLPSVVVTSILLIPTSLALAFILPGVKFIPLGDLVNLVVVTSFLCVATKGNVVRSYIIGIPIVILHLYLASNAPIYMQTLQKALILSRPVMTEYLQVL